MSPSHSESHYEISPRERDDEDRWHEREFGTQELADEDARDRILRSSSSGPYEDEE